MMRRQWGGRTGRKVSKGEYPSLWALSENMSDVLSFLSDNYLENKVIY